MKNKIVIYAVMITGLLGILADSATAGIPIRLSFRDTTIASGTIIQYPLYVDSSLSGYSITAYQVEFTYNTSLFKFDSASSAGTMTGSWGTPTAFEISPGRVRIAAAGVDTLVGKGKLVNLKLHSFLFTGPYNQSGSFVFQSSVLNQGYPPADYRTGNVTLTPGPSIVVSPNTALLTKGDLVQFGATGGTSPYTWSSTSPSVATIDVLGKLTGLSAGFTKIVATDVNSYVDTSGLVEVRAFKLSFRDTSRYQGQTMNIPVYCTDLTDLDITAGQFTVTFSSSLWTADSVIVAGTLLSSYGTPTFSAGSGTMSISFAGTTPLAGSGILFYIRMRAKTTSYGGSAIGIQNSVFNQNLLGNAVSGYLNVLQLPLVTVAPSNAQNLVVGDSLHFTASGGTAPYTWSVSDTERAVISSAGWLKAIKGGDITVTAMDVVGGTGSSGIISLYDFKLSIPDSIFIPDSVVQIPMRVTSNAIGFSSVQFVLTYNTNTFLKLVDVVSAGTLTSGFTFASSYGTGNAKIAAAGINAVNLGGTLIFLKFVIPDSTPISSTTTINITSVTFNEGSPRPLIDNGSIQIGNRSVISVTPQSLILNAPVGFKDSAEITVYNLGNINLTSTLTVVGSSAFTVSLSSINVSPGGNVKPKIYFQPTSPGLDSALIRFNTNDPFHSVVTIAVKGTNNPTSVNDESNVMPSGFVLEQNYPNPFNPATTLVYDLPVRSRVRLTIYNLAGQVIARLVDQVQATGNHQQNWNAENLSSGVYIYRIEAMSLTEPFQHIDLVKKMILLK